MSLFETLFKDPYEDYYYSQPYQSYPRTCPRYATPSRSYYNDMFDGYGRRNEAKPKQRRSPQLRREYPAAPTNSPVNEKISIKINDSNQKPKPVQNKPVPTNVAYKNTKTVECQTGRLDFEVYQDSNQYVLEIMVPGVKKEDLVLEYDENKFCLRLIGERRKFNGEKVSIDEYFKIDESVGGETMRSSVQDGVLCVIFDKRV